MVMSETEFNPAGYAEVQAATVLAGLRWSLTQMLLQRESMGMNNPLATNLFLSPLMGLSLFIACGFLEGYQEVFYSPFFATLQSTLSILGVLSFGGLIAFFMVIFEFKLIAVTSVVTFSVAGIAKEIVTIVTAAIVFGDTFTGNKIVGLIISIAGIGMYNYVRVRAVKEKLKAGGIAAGDDSLGQVAKERGVGIGKPLMESIDDDFEDEYGEDDDDGDLGFSSHANSALYGLNPVISVAAAVPNSFDSARVKTDIPLEDVFFDPAVLDDAEIERA